MSITNSKNFNDSEARPCTELYKVSIVTINLNHVGGLNSTIVSIAELKAKEKDYLIEYVVIDGRSTDGSIDLINRNMHIIDKIVSEKDAGLYYAMRKGVTLSQSERIIFINSGDKVLVEPFRDALREMTKSDMAYAARARMGNKIIAYRNAKLLAMPAHQAIFFPRDFLMSTDFEYQFNISADLIHKIELHHTSRMIIIDQEVVSLEPDGISTRYRRFSDVSDRAKAHYKIARKYYGRAYGCLNFVKIIITKSPIFLISFFGLLFKNTKKNDL